MKNAKMDSATGALAVMRSIDRNPNPQVAINQLIPHFPRTPNTVSRMTGTLSFPFLGARRID
jgi:hypothetical protein